MEVCKLSTPPVLNSFGQVVATVAGNKAGAGQTRFEEEHFAEFDQSRIFDFNRFNGVNGFGGLNGGAQRHQGAGDGAAESKFFHESLSCF